MKSFKIFLPLMVLAVALLSTPAASQQHSVLTYHGDPERSGNFIVPALTWERARSLHLDKEFEARVSGHVYAQPLYWRPPSSRSGMLIVATENDTVHALDAVTGKEVWQRALGKPVSRSLLRCGNINPLGITGTPVIDEVSGTVYLDAAVEDSSGPRHLIFGMWLKDGSSVAGWPVDVAAAMEAKHLTFNPRDQSQRAALSILDGTLYVAFGGHFGDCGQYHGWVVGVSLDNSSKVDSWSTRARGGGIWAPGGLSTVGHSLFLATGNTLGAETWGDGEAIFRLGPDLRRTNNEKDFFAPLNWRALDNEDADLGGTNPLFLDAPKMNGTQALILALGKDGRAYILDRNNLGGIGGSLAVKTVIQGPIRTAPATFSTADAVFVALQGEGSDCPTRRGSNALTVLKIRAGSPPTMTTPWCGALSGAGAPIVTTTDGHANPIVWILGAEGDNRLHGFKGDTGEPLFSGGGAAELMTGLRHFQTLIATDDRLYVGADGRVYAFAF
jgi:outer membrane protein assembly factor BamB